MRFNKNELTAEKQAERNHSNLTAESGAYLRCAGCERGGSVLEVRDRPRDVLRAQRCAAIRGQAFQPRGMKMEEKTFTAYLSVKLAI